VGGASDSCSCSKAEDKIQKRIDDFHRRGFNTHVKQVGGRDNISKKREHDTRQPIELLEGGLLWGFAAQRSDNLEVIIRNSSSRNSGQGEDHGRVSFRTGKE